MWGQDKKGDAGMDQSRIGTFITERRREKGLTQAQLAERLNITDRAVSGFPPSSSGISSFTACDKSSFKSVKKPIFISSISLIPVMILSFHAVPGLFHP